jgi:hypothetical protein
MEAVFLKLIAQLNSSVFVLLLVLGVSYWSVFKITKWVEKFKGHFKGHDDKLKDLVDMRDAVVELRTKVDLIYRNTNPSSPVASRSPLSLTDIGQQIAAKINANEILDKNYDKLSKDVELKNGKNPYDIQLASMLVAKEDVLNLLNEQELILVKQEAFSRGLLVEDVTAVFGILLRDRIFTEKNIPIAEVDKHTPKAK